MELVRIKTKKEENRETKTIDISWTALFFLSLALTGISIKISGEQSNEGPRWLSFFYRPRSPQSLIYERKYKTKSDRLKSLDSLIYDMISKQLPKTKAGKVVVLVRELIYPTYLTLTEWRGFCKKIIKRG